jgi:rubrerythrin
VSRIGDAIAARYAAAGTDAALLQAALTVEELTALAYDAAATGSLGGAERAQARRFADQEREHAAAFATLLFALTVPVRAHARDSDLDELAPGLAEQGRRATLATLAQLEQAALAGHVELARRLAALDALRTVGSVAGGAAQHLVVLRTALGQDPLTPFL